ncbi:uncharacterized protein LOC124920751 [Impatiens glandulifera]|uniref:uncharacterized protein LOC124920751 n=1 Tax=Impatiens glandulifera TaxID=253017 RepID=UPI001FB12458|nr:uncharacterized protein LOC124920751 [Impatiens glandulifera]
MVSELDAHRNQEDKEETQINTDDSSSSDYLSSSLTNSSNDERSRMSRKKKYENDVLTMHNSDHTSAIICTTIFNGGNYIGWSSGMRLALEAKSKLGFIDGSLVVRKESEVFDKWRKMDCLVRSWILNTMSDEIKSNYSSTTTALDLWLDIKERYQENNGPQSYQIQKAISNLRQDQPESSSNQNSKFSNIEIADVVKEVIKGLQTQRKCKDKYSEGC